MGQTKLTLEDSVTKLKFISDKYSRLLENLGIANVKDLLTHFPRYHIDTATFTPIKDIRAEGNYTLKGNVRQFKSVYTRNRKTLQKAYLVDPSGRIEVTWFNQNYLANVFKDDPEVILSGKVVIKNGVAYLTNPQYDVVSKEGEAIHLGRITPTYALTAGISSKWLRRRIKELLEDYDINLETPTDEYFNLNLLDALHKIHFPDSENDNEVANLRLAYEELIAILIRVAEAKSKMIKGSAPTISIPTVEITKFIHELPFELTADQQSTVEIILRELGGNIPMNRLIQGDVGSGKTIVAVIAALAALHNNYQVAILAPTVVLAEQHYNNVSKLLRSNLFNVVLVTGSTKKLEFDPNKPSLFIGTTAILARKHDLFNNLGLVIVDEQHRFGVNQREDLKVFISSQKYVPHLLDMTATPIPRTIALTFFGDVDVATIRTKPAGRLPIHTKIIPGEKRKDSYEWIKQQIDDGRQVYWICPLIEESETLEIKSAKQLYEELSTSTFKDYRIALLHGKLKDKEKVEIMTSFKEGKIDLLVSTTVIEVGIDVANATIMVIEDADRMGLAQLHQIRGRVGRSELQSWCFVFESLNINERGKERLRYFATHTDGLEIAEFDLQLRGPGEVYGTRQAGIPDLKIAKLNNLEMIMKAKELATELYTKGVNKLPLF